MEKSGELKAGLKSIPIPIPELTPALTCSKTSVMMRCHYDSHFIYQSSHNRTPLACPSGSPMRCHLGVPSLVIAVTALPSGFKFHRICIIIRTEEETYHINNNFYNILTSVVGRALVDKQNRLLTCQQGFVVTCHSLDQSSIYWWDIAWTHISLKHHSHWGQPCKATVIKMAPTRPLTSRSFCLLTSLCDPLKLATEKHGGHGTPHTKTTDSYLSSFLYNNLKDFAARQR